MTNQYPKQKKSCEEIKRRILEAFRDVQLEDGISMHEADVMDSHGSPAERSKARALDQEKSWTEIAPQKLEKNESVFSYADAKSFRFYLPAFMIWTLDNFPASGGRAINAVYPTGIDDPAYPTTKNINGLNDLQKQAVALFLRYFAELECESEDCDAARNGLDNYWSLYE